MLVAVGLSTTDLKSLDHAEVVLTSPAALDVFHLPGNASRDSMLKAASGAAGKPVARIRPGQRFKVKASEDPGFEAFDGGKKLDASEGWLLIRGSNVVSIQSIKRAAAKGNVGASYRGAIAIFPNNGKLRVALILDLDKYLGGVLQSEIPASYHIEAVKAQAVAARTYGLNPRVNHDSDRVNVCDSWLCCQYFGGLTTVSSATHARAIKETLGQILVYNEKPILALFSSNAGGHTENYENCFSDAQTGQFPPPALPYLVGVPETADKKKLNLSEEKNLRSFYAGAPHTVDSWSPHFKWRVHLSGDDLEANMHATVQAMLKDDRAPFVVAPPSGKFGHVESISVLRRGVSGCAIELAIKTSSGEWRVSKELVIRDLFKTPDKKLARLKSGRFFLDHQRDGNGYISAVTISGMGWGHGVGLQQTGAQGWAKQGWNYRSILLHYFPGTTIDKV